MARPTRPPRDRKVQPPRPPNAWILYRSEMFKRIRENGDRLSQADVSKIVSDMWKNETEEVKRQYEQLAESRKAQHQEQYPDYRFCPKKKEARASRKKSRAREATVSDIGEGEGATADAPPPLPTLPAMPYMHPQSGPPAYPVYHRGLVMPQHFLVPYMPEACYGPGGSSSSMFVAPSPAPREGSNSPLQPRSASSSSLGSSNRSSPSSESRASSSSSQPSANSTHLPSVPSSHHPSPNPYATLPLSTLLQSSTPDELPSPRLQLRPAENTVVPAAPGWNSVAAYPPIHVSPDSEEVAGLNIAITQHQTYTELEQAISPSASFDPLQGLLSGTDENGIFSLSNIETSALLAQPEGDLEVVLGPQPETIEYSDDIFAEFDFDEFERQMGSLAESGSNSILDTSRPFSEDLRSLFHTPHNPGLQAYTTAQQRQSSALTQEMLSFLNFEALESSTEDATPAVSPTTSVAPQQVTPAMSIFSQVTNTPAFSSGSSYVPPAGAIYSSTRRVGGSWKPKFVMPGSLDDEFPFWDV